MIKYPPFKIDNDVYLNINKPLIKITELLDDVVFIEASLKSGSEKYFKQRYHYMFNKSLVQVLQEIEDFKFNYEFEEKIK